MLQVARSAAPHAQRNVTAWQRHHTRHHVKTCHALDPTGWAITASGCRVNILSKPLSYHAGQSRHRGHQSSRLLGRCVPGEVPCKREREDMLASGKLGLELVSHVRRHERELSCKQPSKLVGERVVHRR